MPIKNDTHTTIEQAEYKVETALCKNGLLTLLVVSNGGRERLLHSKYDPVGEAKKQIKDISQEISNFPVVLVFGLGMAYHILEIQAQIPEGGMVYVFEPCPNVLRLFSENNGYSLLDSSRVRVLALLSETDYNLEEIITIDNCDAFCFYSHPVYTKLFIEQHNILVGKINEISTRLRTQKNSMRELGVHWSKNFLSNSKYLYDSAAVSGLFGLFQGKTAIIVSAGPSLSRNVALLERAKDKAVIICCDAAYRAVVQSGIKPDLIVSVSGSPFSYRKVEGMVYNIPLIYKSQTSHQIVENHDGMKFYSNYNNDFLDEILHEAGIDVGFIDSGGSVACSCLDLAVKMGADKVIFIGQDLALTNGREYSEHVTSPFSREKNQKFIENTVDIYGNQIKTLQNLNYYRKWFEDYIESCQNVRFIDATEGGALIEGTEIMTLDSALGMFARENLDVSDKINSAYSENRLDNTKQIVGKRYALAYGDFLRAKALTQNTISNYESNDISRGMITEIIEMLLSYTEAIKYSILPDIYDINNANTGQLPDIELFKKILRSFDEITPFFERAIGGYVHATE